MTILKKEEAKAVRAGAEHPWDSDCIDIIDIIEEHPWDEDESPWDAD